MLVREFFETIFGDSEGHLFISTFAEDGKLTNHKAFKYPESLNTIVSYCEMRSDTDLYFSPMLYGVPRRKSVSVTVTPVIYCDTDEFDVNDFLIKPSINVQTSADPVKHHSYWLLDDTYTPEQVSSVARAIALAHAKKINGVQLGTDPSGWDLTQLLRVPNSVNTKHTPPQPVQVDGGDGTVYSLAELEEAYDPSNLPTVPLSPDTEVPDDLPSAADVLRKIVVNDTLNDLYAKVPNGDWSDTLYLFVSEMFRAGFTPEEVLVGAWNCGSNKYKRDGRPMGDLWRYDVLNAQADPANKPLSKTERIAQEVETAKPRDEGISAVIEAELIHEGEHELLTNTFVDRYVKWGASKTDAPEAYHVAGALTMMSCVLGEWGVAFPQFGDLRLGLMFVIMGETTDTRKSTARMLMKKVLRMTQIAEKYEYIFSGDVTPETLLDALSEKPHQSSLYDRDEFQNLVRDIKHKPYMAGFFETMNELYDGWARGRMRKEKRTKDTPVNFVQYAMGIRSQIQDNLEVSDFMSGYLPRNIFVRGEAPPRTRENSRLRQGKPDEAGVDREFMEIVKSLTTARNYWAGKVKDRATPEKILFEDDAWERWDQFAWDLRQYVDNHPRRELLIPSVQRLAFNVLKVAALLAMMDQREKGTMQDVLNAIYFGVQWVEDLIIVASGVSESMLQRELDKIENYVIEHDGLVTYASMIKWANGNGMRKRDLTEYLESLRDSNVIKIVEDGQGRKSVELYD